MDLIGLTGGIASGKSTVARMLRDAGIDVIDADALAREVVAKGSEGLALIMARFGADILDPEGELDRAKLGARVFADDEARRDLNRIVHPLVAQRAQERAQALAAAGRRYVVYDVPLLFENQLHLGMAATLLVAVPEEVQIRRLKERDGLDEEAALARIRAQMPLAEKKALATFVIDNSGPLEETARQLSDVWERITHERVAFRAPGSS